MKAITLKPWWATDMLDGLKTVECRSWKTTHRGNLLICAGAKREPGCVFGNAILVANLVDVVPFTADHMAAAAMEGDVPENCYAWVFDKQLLIYPFPVSGKPGLFSVPDEKIKLLPPEMSNDEVCAIFEAITA